MSKKIQVQAFAVENFTAEKPKRLVGIKAKRFSEEKPEVGQGIISFESQLMAYAPRRATETAFAREVFWVYIKDLRLIETDK